MKSLKETRNNIQGLLNQISGSFSSAIVILPIVGVALGVGASFTNPLTIETYGLTGIMGEGTFLNLFFTVLKNLGLVIFQNLAIIFAVTIAIGMTKAKRQFAGLTAVVSFLAMHSTISSILLFRGDLGSYPEGAIGSILGIESLQMGVFGGIIVGGFVAYLHDKFYDKTLPNIVSFFSGTRFAFIVTVLLSVPLGFIMYLIYPTIQSGIFGLGYVINQLGLVGTFIFGFVERFLIPFGLSHIFYLPFWQTPLGGTELIDGIQVSGAQNIFFAQLASPDTVEFSTQYTRYMSGKFPFYFFGLAGIGLAMYQTTPKDKRGLIGGLIISALLTAILTGITEPIEFMFLITAPILWVVHSILAGLSFVLTEVLRLNVGMSFSGSIIDFILFGVLQGNDKTNWIRIFLFLPMFPIYYFLFKFLIVKFNFKHVGNSGDEKDSTSTSKLEIDDTSLTLMSMEIINLLGGADNIKKNQNCATKLRVEVVNKRLCTEDEASLTKTSKVQKVFISGNNYQFPYGNNNVDKIATVFSKTISYLRNKEGV